MRPLDGVKVIEMAGLAPAPFCGMILADFGADVVVVERLKKDAPENPAAAALRAFDRGKRSVRIDARTEDGRALLCKMIAQADVLLEPFRPGVMEKLGFGPDAACAPNPRLIYARLTGWGQDGPYAAKAGHDINYIALSGALSLFRHKGQKPVPPGNLLADFAGGGMLCALGILLALIERGKSGQGQIVDAAMLDGTASLTTLFYALWAERLMSPEIGTNLLDGGAPFYQTYETADDRFMAVGAIESQFYHALLEGLGIDPQTLPPQYDITQWDKTTEQFARIFRSKTQAEWCAVFKQRDACVAPVLTLAEAASDPHNRERGLFYDLDGMQLPAPAPRLLRTPARADRPARPRGAETKKVLAELGLTQAEIERLFRTRIVE